MGGAQLWTGLILAAAAGLGIARLPWRGGGPARLITLAALQSLAAILLYLTLHPPAAVSTGEVLTVATRGAPARPAGWRGAWVALPESPHADRQARAPDLATAIRQHPAASRVRLVGHGLEPRDRVPLDLPLQLALAPPPVGITDLFVPPSVTAGAEFTVSGAVGGLARGQVELVDPGGAVVDAAPVIADGRFVLRGRVLAAGPAEFAVRLKDTSDREVERLVAPVLGLESRPPTVRVLAGAPNADLRHLRRWAEGARVELEVDIDVGGGVRLGDATRPLSREGLRELDLLVIDDRRWETLSGAGRAAILSAVDDGLGLLLQPGGALPPSTQRDWAGLGLRLTDSGRARPLQLAPEEQPRDQPPEVTARGALAPDASAVSLVRAPDGQTLARWTSRGRGRIGLLTVSDSYVLVLTGAGERYGALWSPLFTALARADAPPPPSLIGLAFAGERATLCGISDGDRLFGPGDAVSTLKIDPYGPQGCAAFWPPQPGWAHVGAAESANMIYVHPAQAAPALRAAQARAAAERAALGAPRTAAVEGVSRRRGSPWPWLLGLLLALTALWLLERRGRPKAELTGG
jgi:hypothetical protein